MIDVEELKEQGLDVQALGGVIDIVLFGVQSLKGAEAEWLKRYLAGIRDECEGA